VAVEDFGQPVGVLSEVLKRDGAVLDEGDGLSLILHRHHDVEAGLADLGDLSLEALIGDWNHAAPANARAAPVEAEVAHRLGQSVELFLVGRLRAFVELDEEDGGGLATDEAFNGGAEERDLARQTDHGRVHEFDRDRVELHEVLGRVHRLVEGWEVTDAEHPPPDHRPEPHLDGGEIGERALRADEKVGEVDRLRVGHEGVEVIAADAAIQLGEAGVNQVGVARPKGEHLCGDPVSGGVAARALRGDGAEACHAAVGEDRLDREDVVAHGAVAQRPPAAGIVGRHAADGGARGGGDVDREPEVVRLQDSVELVEDHAGLYNRAAVLDVELDDAVEVPGVVNDEAAVDGLAALGGAPAPPRPVMGTPSSRATASVAATSSREAGTTTPCGMIW
jgi:hypothetical protein